MNAQVDGVDGSRSGERLAAWFDNNSEGLWRIDLNDPLPHSATKALLLDDLFARGTVAECNAAMASMLQADASADPVGMPLDRYPFFAPILEALNESQFNLVDWELPATASREGCVVNAVGVFEDERLARIWGRCRRHSVGRDLEILVMNALEEQQREIGYELHDGLGQLLIAARLVSYNIADLAASSHDEICEQCGQLASLTDQALELLQRITRELTPGQLLNGSSLVDAMEGLANTTNRFPDIHCTCNCDEEAQSIDQDKHIHVYRIMQEAVNNAVKHAQARHVEISLKKVAPDLVQFVITDDGVGFNVEEKGKNSLGLKSMVHRARLMGARLEIDSVPGKSTTIRCAVPAKANDNERDRQADGRH